MDRFRRFHLPKRPGWGPERNFWVNRSCRLAGPRNYENTLDPSKSFVFHIAPDYFQSRERKKAAEGPTMCMKTKDEKSDKMEGPTMLMKNKVLTERGRRVARGARR